MPSYTPTTGTGDALAAKARYELKIFTDWLTANNVRGLVGEFGIPGSSNPGADFNYDSRWDLVMQQWFIDCNAHLLHTTNWVSAEWALDLRAYRNLDGNNDALNVATTTATVLEQNLSVSTGTASTSYMRGVNMAGADFSDYGPNGALNLSSPGAGYYYALPGDFTYLYGRGVRLVRFPFRWERIQKTLGGALDTTELGLLTASVNAAGAAGIQVLLDCHNYGRYDTQAATNTTGSTSGVYALGQNAPDSTTMLSKWLDFWNKFSTAFAGNSAVWGFGLTNEPNGLPGGMSTWQTCSAAAVETIRLNTTTKYISVGGYTYSTIPDWLNQNGSTAWLTGTIPAGQPGAGSARNTDPYIVFEGHHYWDGDHSGSYNNSYSTELSNAQGAGFGSYTNGTGNPPALTNSSQTGQRQVFASSMDSPASFSALNANTNTLTIPYAVGNPGNSLRVIGSATSDEGSVRIALNTNNARDFSFDFQLPTGSDVIDPGNSMTIAHFWDNTYANDLIEITFVGSGSGYKLQLKQLITGYPTTNGTTVFNKGAWINIRLDVSDSGYRLYVNGATGAEVTLLASLSGKNIGGVGLGKFYAASYTGPMLYDNALGTIVATYDAPNGGGVTSPTPPAPVPAATAGLLGFL